MKYLIYGVFSIVMKTMANSRFGSFSLATLEAKLRTHYFVSMSIVV